MVGKGAAGFSTPQPHSCRLRQPATAFQGPHGAITQPGRGIASLSTVPNKSYSKNLRTCRVTLERPAVLEATAASVVGDFNGWSDAAIPMKKRKDGRLSVTVSLEPG